MSSVVNLFLDLIKLKSNTTKGMFYSLPECLLSYGMMENYLKTHLVHVSCDGAAVMMSSKGLPN
jgi:hypothetical protein